MYSDIDEGQEGNGEVFLNNFFSVAAYAARFPKGHVSFLGPGAEEMWYSILAHKPNGSRNRVAELMMINFGESGHIAFRGTSAFFRGAQ